MLRPISFNQFVFLACTFLSQTLFAQQQNIPLSWQFSTASEDFFMQAGEHTSMKPLLQSRIYKHATDTHFQADKVDPNLYRYEKNEAIRRLPRKLFYENLIHVDSGDFWLSIDPLFHFSKTWDMADTSGKNLYTNTRGIIVRGNIGQTFSFTSSFYENQSFFPDYIDEYIETKAEWIHNKNTNTWQQRPGYGVVPGQGRTKPFKKTGYDYAFSQGYISFSPKHWINFQAGQDKHFIGDGYRSLLLSDAASNYPFFKTTVWAFKNKLQYTILYNSLIDLQRTPNPTTPEANFFRKSGSFQYLAYRFNKWVSLGFFQGIIWQRMDYNGTLDFNPHYLNPLIYVNTGLYGFNHANHAVVGNTLKVQLPLKSTLYGQYALDGFNMQFAWQAGLKIRAVKNLSILAEFNSAKENIYKSQTPFQQYSHYNEPLAHPFGNHFREFVCIVQYNYKRLFADAKYVSALKDPFHNNIFSTMTNLPWPVSNGASLANFQSSINYMVNRRNNMHVFVGFMYRNFTYEYYSFYTLDNEYIFGNTTLNKQYTLLSFGIKTQLFNTYYDF